MEFKEQKKYNNYGENSAEEQLEQALDNPDGLGNNEFDGKNERKKEVEKKIFIQKDDFSSGQAKKELFKDLAWYWGVIKKPVIVLASLEILLYILALIPRLKLLMVDVFDPILLVVDFVFFGWIAWQVKGKKGESLWQTAVTLFLAGFALGLVTSIFKALWIREFWTIFNLIVEPVYVGIIAIIVGLVVSLVIKRKNK